MAALVRIHGAACALAVLLCAMTSMTAQAASAGTAQVVAGGSHACVLRHDGAVKCWGANGSGQLGLGDTAARGDGANELADTLPIVSLGGGRTATAVAAGTSHTCALLDNGTVKCWGANGSGQLGLGDTAARGDSAGEMGDSLPAVSLGTGRSAVAIAAGDQHTCALLDDGAVKCWGANASGQLGLGDTIARGDGASEMGDNLPSVDLGTGRTATAIAAGGTHTCALLDDGVVKCWGANASGQLGLGDTAARGDVAGEMGDSLPTLDLGTGRTATAITAGASHTCALLDNGRPSSAGARTRPASSASATRPTAATTPARWATASPPSTSAAAAPRPRSRPGTSMPARCSTTERSSAGARTPPASSASATPPRAATAPARWATAFPPSTLGSGRTATGIATGSASACALLDNHTVKCWGANASGQLGLGDTAARGDGAGEMGDSLPAVDLGTDARSQCSRAGPCTRARCWTTAASSAGATNGLGQLGLGDTAIRGDGAERDGRHAWPPSISAAATPRPQSPLATTTPARCWTTRSVKCWGSNAFGQLGLGDTANRGDNAGEMGDALPAVDLGSGRTAIAIATGGTSACALLDDRTR